MNEKFEMLRYFLSENSERYRENSLIAYETGIKQFFEYCPKSISEVKQDDIIDWINYLSEQRYSSRTKQLRLAALNAFFGFCIEECVIRKSPTLDVKYPKIKNTPLPKYFDEGTFFRIKEGAKNNPRDRAILETFFSSGVRVSELIQILIIDVDFDTKQIWIREGKGCVERFVLINEETKHRLKKYLETRKDNSPYLIVSRLKRPFTRQGIHKIIKKYVIKAGVDLKISSHSFRHSFATYLAERGVEFDVIQSLLGVIDPNTVRIYAQLTESVRKKIYDRFNK